MVTIKYLRKIALDVFMPGFKTRQDAANNKIDFRVFYHVLRGDNYAQIIGQREGRTEVPTLKILRRLKGEGFIDSYKQTRYNKTLYYPCMPRLVRQLVTVYMRFLWEDSPRKLLDLVKNDKGLLSAFLDMEDLQEDSSDAEATKEHKLLKSYERDSTVHRFLQAYMLSVGDPLVMPEGTINYALEELIRLCARYKEYAGHPTSEGESNKEDVDGASDPIAMNVLILDVMIQKYGVAGFIRDISHYRTPFHREALRVGRMFEQLALSELIDTIVKNPPKDGDS